MLGGFADCEAERRHETVHGGIAIQHIADERRLSGFKGFGFNFVHQSPCEAETLPVVSNDNTELGRLRLFGDVPARYCAETFAAVFIRFGCDPSTFAAVVESAEGGDAFVGYANARVKAQVVALVAQCCNELLEPFKVFFKECAHDEALSGLRFEWFDIFNGGSFNDQVRETALGCKRRIVAFWYSL